MDPRLDRLAEIIRLEKIVNELKTDSIKAEEIVAQFRAKAGKDLESYKKAQEDVNEIKKEEIKLEKLLEQIKQQQGDTDTDEYKFLVARRELLKQQGEFLAYELSLINKGALVQQDLNKKLEAHLKTLGSSIKSYVGGFSDWLSFFNDIDKSFRNTVFQMGMSQKSSSALGDNLAKVGSYAASLGSNFQEIAKMQASIVDLTGRQVVLTEANMRAMAEIAKGTTLGVDGASQMVAEFDKLGFSASAVRDLTEGTLNDAAKLGLNGNKTISDISKNLNKAQGYGFKNGIDGLKNMVLFSQKLKLNIDGVFSSADTFSNLEGAIDGMAQLNVLGGKFAQSDPFKMLYLARNDVEGFAKEIASMTDGLVKFDKSGKALPLMGGDLQRMKLAAKALNMDYKDLIETAQQGAKNKAIEGLVPNLKKEDRELISSLADMQGGKYVVKLDDGILHDIQSLSSGQIDALKKSQETLAQRAKDNQAVDEQFKNAMIELKSSLIPYLEGFSKVVTLLSSSGIPKWVAAAATIGVAATTMMMAGKTIGGFVGKISGGIVGKIMGGGKGAVGGGLGDAAGKGGGFMEGLKGGMGSLGSMLPAMGQALLVAGALELAIWGLGLALQSWIPVIPVIADGMKVLAKAFGDFIVEVSADTVGEGLLKTAIGIGALGLAMTTFGIGAVLGGGLGILMIKDLTLATKDLTGSSKTLMETATGLTSIATAYESIAKNINSINIDNLKELRETSATLSKVSITQGIFDTLSKAFDKPMKLQLDDSNKIVINTDITLKIDSDVLIPKLAIKVQKSLIANKKGNTSKAF